VAILSVQLPLHRFKFYDVRFRFSNHVFETRKAESARIAVRGARIGYIEALFTLTDRSVATLTVGSFSGNRNGGDVQQIRL
jgi:hypothetical protein